MLKNPLVHILVNAHVNALVSALAVSHVNSLVNAFLDTLVNDRRQRRGVMGRVGRESCSQRISPPTPNLHFTRRVVL